MSSRVIFISFQTQTIANGGLEMGFMSKMLVNTAKKKVKSTVKDLAVSKTTEVAVNYISNRIGIPEAVTGKILGRGIPGMIFAGSEDPTITERLFGSLKNKDKKRTRKESEDHFFDIFGSTGRILTEGIAKDTETDEEDVSGVMGLFMSTFESILGEEEPEDAGMLHKLFRNEAKEIEKESPSLAKMAMNLII